MNDNDLLNEKNIIILQSKFNAIDIKFYSGATLEFTISQPMLSDTYLDLLIKFVYNNIFYHLRYEITVVSNKLHIKFMM